VFLPIALLTYSLFDIGEYVIMVQDITTPPFMDVRLEPAFMLVKVLLPAPVKKAKKATVKKDRGPK